jgi:thiopeptide-type bacteriocin biosynthesis protein
MPAREAVVAAGTAAAIHELSRRSRWLQYSLEQHGWERIVSGDLQARLRVWLDEDPDRAFFFVHKPPGVRVGFRGVEDDFAGAITPTFEALAAEGAIRSWTIGPYDADVSQLGGPVGLDLTHRFFTAESVAVLAHHRLQLSGTARLDRELFSLILIDRLLGQVTDAWETWDVWCKMTFAGRPADTQSAISIDAGDPRIALTLLNHQSRVLDAVSNDERELFAHYDAGLERLAPKIHAAVEDGTLSWGIREILPFWIARHWNRMRFPAQTQERLSALMVRALSPLQHAPAPARRASERGVGATSCSTPLSLATRQLRALCKAVGAEERADLACAAMEGIMGAWGEWPFERVERIRSFSEDGTPFETSVAFEDGGVAVRGLVAAPAASARGSWEIGLRTNRLLEAHFGANLARFERVRELFAPGEAAGPFSIWHGFSLEPDGQTVFKVYLNPTLGRADGADARVAEALKRLGLDRAWAVVERAIARGRGCAGLAFFSLDLTAGNAARVKVYLRHRPSGPQGIERVLALSPHHQPGDAELILTALTGTGERYGHFLPLTQMTFTRDAATTPCSVSLHVPLGTYAQTDEIALERIGALVGRAQQPTIERAVRAVARRRLMAGAALISWVSARRTDSGMRVTLYLAGELFGGSGPRAEIVDER